MTPDSQHGPQRDDSGAAVVVEPDPAESTLDAVVRGISAVKGVTVEDFYPLCDSVDVDALESVIEHATERDNDLSASFTVERCAVTVHSGGPIRIRDDPLAGTPS